MRGTATDRIYVGESTLGSGIFARRNFQRGEFLFRFSGPIINLTQAIAKGETEGNVLQIGPYSYVDLEAPGVFGNHSCNPNAGLRDEVFCYALRDIVKNEEIFYDYSTTMSERRWTMQCKCGAACCRGVIGDFHDLLFELQRRYLAMKIVQPFIVAESIERAKRQAMPPCSVVATTQSGPLPVETAPITRYAPC